LPFNVETATYNVFCHMQVLYNK